jgi:hypothetical protein
LGTALAEMTASFERLCLAAGLEALGAMMEADVAALCDPRHGRGGGRRAQRGGRRTGPIGVHGGKILLTRPRVRTRGGQDLALPSWKRAVAEDWLGRWAMTLMRIGVTTRRFGRAVRLPEADVQAGPVSGISRSAASRRFVALSAERLEAWLAADLSRPDLLAVQIDGIHLAEDLRLVVAGRGRRHRRRGQEAPARPGRGSDGERRGGAGAARRPGEARARSLGAASAATSSAGAMRPWRCDGRPALCLRQLRASAV